MTLIRCRSCNLKIGFIELTSGRKMTVDPTLVKTFGSSMKPGESSLTIPAGGANMAGPADRLKIADGPNGEILLKVSLDPDVQAQMDAFKAEMEGSATSLPITIPEIREEASGETIEGEVTPVTE